MQSIPHGIAVVIMMVLRYVCKNDTLLASKPYQDF